MKSFARAKVRAALFALTCAGVLLSSAETASFQGHTISYANATTNWVANAETGGDDLVLVFSDTTAAGSFTLPNTALLAEMRVLAVGGGGAGGSGAFRSTARASRGNGGNGGGGGGGVVASNALYFAAGDFSVTVGAGGAAAASGSSAAVGSSGSPSSLSFDSIVVVRAEGGGGGGAQSKGNDGASGGGGSSTTSSGKVVTQDAGVAVDGQGFAGGSGDASMIGGGGGGAGAAGADASAGGAGGDGVANDITGVSVYYGGGGAGGYVGTVSTTEPAAGGNGGGGAGGVESAQLAVAGTDGLGGGGGGGGTQGSSAYAIGGAGGSGVVIVRISAIYTKPSKPSATVSAVYDGKEHAAFAANNAYEITGVWKATDAGTCTATVALKTALVEQGLTWDDGTTDPVTVTMTISKAANAIRDLSLDGWIVGGLPNAASATATFGKVSLSWSDSETGTFSPYAQSVGYYPTEVGKYWLKATVDGTANYEGAEALLAFYVWADPGAAYDDAVTIDLSGLTASETLENFPVLVRLSESAIHGFLYSRAGATGENLAFTSEDGAVLCPHEVDVWDTAGESLVWVRVPQLTPTTKIVMRWCAKDGVVTPAYAPESVWSEYLGVWHFAGASTDSRFKDSTGHGLTACLDSGASCAVESSTRIGSALRVTGGNLLAPDCSAQMSDASRFAFSAWASAPEYANAMRICGKTTGTELSSGALKDGWAIKLTAANRASWLWTKGLEGNVSLAQSLKTEMALMGLSADAGAYVRAAIFSDPDAEAQLKSVTSPSFAVGANTEPLRLAAGGVVIDEARLAAKPFSKAWLRAEYLTAVQPTTVSGFVARAGKMVDWWTSAASISKTTWRTNETAGVLTAPVLDSGRAVTVRYVDLADPTAELSAMPEEPGCYRVVYEIAEEDGYESLETTIDFQILGAVESYDDLKGGAFTLTRSGRVLLANDDTVAGHAVTDQGWWQEQVVKIGGSNRKPKLDTNTVFWVHSGVHSANSGSFRDGVDHDLSYGQMGSETNVIWRLRNVLIGSPYASDNTLGGRCALPYSSTSKKISAYGSRTTAATAPEAGMMMLRNQEDAAIYSMCYTNGIGTIYFDAVNLLPTTAGDDYSIVVEVATNTVDVAEDGTPLPPTDANCAGRDANDAESEFGRLDKGGGESCWQKMPVIVLKKDGTDKFVSDGVKDVVPLAIDVSGSDRFYRLVVPVDVRGFCRFRIRREGCVTSDDYKDVDSGAFVVVDNIVVSYPKNVANVVPYGAFDGSRGAAGAMDVAFPSAGESVKGRARLEAWANAVTTNVAASSFVTLSRLNYRWRYLGQQVGDWQTAMLAQKDGDGRLAAVEPLDLPALEGDVEFWFESYLSIPYYAFFDYSGAGLGLSGADGAPLYTESAGDVLTNRYVLAAGETLASGGSDWFFRLRPAKSAYARFRALVCTNETAGVVVTNEMALSASGAWRAFAKTLEAPDDGFLRFRFEGLDPQADGAESYVRSTNRWQAADLASTPGEAAVSAGAGWAKAPCDAKTGYLLFQFTEPADDAAGKVLVARADKQDFNTWSSGLNADGLFVGSSVDTNATSLSTQTYALDFAALSPSVATNARWTVNFDVGASEDARVIYPRNVPFATWPNGASGWSPENAMWVCKRWADETNLCGKTSLQLQGRGLGSFALTTASDRPNGLDSVKFTARVAQANEFEDFTYYNGIVSATESGVTSYIRAEDQTRYTFITKLAMTEVEKSTTTSSFDGDGSVSLVGFYHPQNGCYELRFSRSGTNTILKAELFKWTPGASGRRWSSTSLGSATLGNSTARQLVRNDTDCGAAYLAIETDGAKTTIYGGLYTDSSALSGHYGTTPSFSTDTTQSKFDSIAYCDASSPLTSGTYGILARNCPGVFVAPCAYDQVPVVTSETLADNELKSYVSKGVQFVGTPVQVLTPRKDWVVRAGRMEDLARKTVDFAGFRAVTNVAQKIALQIMPAGSNSWVTVATNEVVGFANQNLSVPVRRGESCSVRLKMVGDIDDVRTDIVLNEVSLTQWAGETTSAFADGSTGYPEGFVHTQAWRVPDEEAQQTNVRLQPARAGSATQAVSLRTPVLDGLGLVGFSWKNADTNAVVKLQMATSGSRTALGNNLRLWTLAGSEDENWTTIETFDFAELGVAGSRMVNVNVRAPVRGVFRLVVDQAVVAAATDAARRASDPLYGSVEISDFFAWDLPAYDDRSWTGWNFRTSGWADHDRTPGPFASLSDYPSGLSGLLNNTLDEDTLADKIPDYYRQRPPSVQSPTFTTNCIGALEFKARLYDADDALAAGHPAAVTVYGADAVDEHGEPTHWKEVGDVTVSNAVYAVHTLKFKNSQNFYALRLAVKGVSGVSTEKPVYASPLRVAIDDVYVWEKSKLAVSFRKDRVRPFRSVDGLKGRAVVPDIDSAEEQPILQESFGFQAEVEVADADEIVLDDPAHPVSVTLWYYPDAEPWGYDNWKTNANAVGVALDTADGTNLVFRSTMANTASICPPQTLAAGETYRVVQYQMVATFYDKSGEEYEQPMTSSEWAMPSWNAGFDDPNEKDGRAFSAFTVLETLAPKRAWINEVNLVEYEGTKDISTANQWIELAVPTGANMTNWTVNVYDYTGSKALTLLKLGRDGPGAKSSGAPVSNYEFYLAKSPHSTLVGADATWSEYATSASASITSGRFNTSQAFGFELVRPSGIVEHRAVVQGNNFWKDYGYSKSIWETYEGTNVTAKLNEATTGGWVWGAEDCTNNNYAVCTVGVTNGQGQVHADWCSPMVATPGDLNAGQVIDPGWFTRPNGGFRWIDAAVSGLHLRQIVGGETNTFASVMVVDGKSTNLVYEVDRWYRLGTPLTVVPATTSTTLSAPEAKDGKTYYTLTVNSLTNDVRITASAKVEDTLDGLLQNVGAYRPAILKWLEDGSASGDFGGEEIKLGKYRGAGADDIDLTLLGHYWLDLDPTCGGWELWGGMGEKGGGTALGQVNMPVVRTNAVDSALVHTNIQTTVWMMITNTATGVAYAPYRLQGLGNEKSDEFGGSWTSATFKIEMRLYNAALSGKFRAMRHFVFGPGSFRSATDDTAPFAARIEVTDPFSRQSPAWEWGWWKYAGEGLAPFTRWNLNEEITPGGVSTLKADDLLAF